MLDEIVGEAANLLEVMPPDAKVFITSGDLEKLMEMQYGFEEYLISDVVFVTPTEVLNGHLRGQLGVLLVEDVNFMTYDIGQAVFQEQDILRWEYDEIVGSCLSDVQVVEDDCR